MEPAKLESKIGDILVDKGLSSLDIELALSEQQSSGEMMGQILLSQGKVNGKQLYSALAIQHGYSYADLFKTPCDRGLLNFKDRDLYVRYGFIPWKVEKGRVHVAVTDPSFETIEVVKEKYGECRLAITSPYDISFAVNKIFANENSIDACDELWNEAPNSSAKGLFSNSINQKYPELVFGSLVTLLMMSMFFKPAFIAINFFYFMTLVFKASIYSVGLFSRKPKSPDVDRIEDDRLPTYTILVPLFKEKERTIKQLVDSIRLLDYPLSKLDVKLIIEESDSETKDVIIGLSCERVFEVIEVPYSLPQTKPKAMNYALRYAKGEYVTIYDAEDMPEAGQLREAISVFRSSPEKLGCVQAKLNYYNRKENVLTRMFALEYGGWFGFLLPGLEKLKIPIPLGGTSNHFPIKILREMMAWDPYNVTEDADLGIRLSARGYKTKVLDSMTWEEAPISFKGWVSQRSRWIKGHMQTYFVHMKDEKSITEKVGMRGYLGFLFFIGGACLVFFSLPFVITSAGIMMASGVVFPEWFLNFSVVNLSLGVGLHVLFAFSVVVQHKWFDMIPYSFIFPFYWLLHPIASFKGGWQLIAKPYYWEKTEHGLTKENI